MSIEERIFLRSDVNFKKLVDYGFKNIDSKYVYTKNIINDTFEMIIEIDNNKIVKGRVIDLAFGDEYTNYRVDDYIGSFNGTIREEFENVLRDIRTNCCDETYFISEQANRIADLIIEKYNNKPEFLWENDFTSGVFRNLDNKWYGIIMYIPRNKLDVGNEKVNVINVKVDTKNIENILLQKGFYKAYHMNKKSWVTIILDDSVGDDVIMNYIIESYLLTSK